MISPTNIYIHAPVNYQHSTETRSYKISIFVLVTICFSSCPLPVFHLHHQQPAFHQCDSISNLIIPVLCPRRVFFRDLVTGVRPTGLLVNECNVILIFIATISLPHFTWIDYNASDNSRLDPTLCNLPSFNI